MITAFGHSESSVGIITSRHNESIKGIITVIKSESPPGIAAREESESSPVYFSMKQKRVRFCDKNKST